MAAHKASTSSVDSSFPCSLPEDELLTLSNEQFEQKLLATFKQNKASQDANSTAESIQKMDLDVKETTFMEALQTAEAVPKVSDDLQELAKDNKTLTTNADVAYISTNSALLDLFIELGRDIAGPRLETLLASAWKVDSLATLKIVWNARSIHLGKGEHDCFYKALGWFSKNHPVTFLLNLKWLVRSVIELEPEKAKDKAVLVDPEDATDTTTIDGFEILHGGSHGYYKDLLNLLVLAANGSLDVNDNPHKILKKPNPQTKKRKCPYPPITAEKRGKDTTDAELRSVEQCKALAKDDKHKRESEYWNRALGKLEDPFYRYLHALVARMFAEQLKIDLDRLESGKKYQLSKITLAAKWAPSLQGFHDKHTIVATSIAEILYPRSFFDPEIDRTRYLKLAREAYRAKYLTPLRAYLDIVERKISKQMFGEINYSKIPSLAMDMYKDLFIRKDFEHFAQYIEKVAQGKAKISGAVLTPAAIIHGILSHTVLQYSHKATSMNELLRQKQAEILNKTISGQWDTLVTRIKQSGKLSSTIAVCDTSGSMYSPTFSDGTTPVHSALGLSLLVAEVTEAPFGNCFITFSSNPKVQSIDMNKPFDQRVSALTKADWGMNTDFVAVFERLILPMAIKNKVAPEAMVKQVIVFSDMQFDSASTHRSSDPKSWESSFERIKRKYSEAGYEMPLLIFWNLAGNGYAGAAPSKPVTKNEYNTMMVSGYSQAMLKMFLSNGGFEDEEDEEEEMEEVGVDVAGEVVTKKVKKVVDPEAGMWKAISHKAYAMLKVYD